MLHLNIHLLETRIVSYVLYRVNTQQLCEDLFMLGFILKVFAQMLEIVCTERAYPILIGV